MRQVAHLGSQGRCRAGRTAPGRAQAWETGPVGLARGATARDPQVLHRLTVRLAALVLGTLRRGARGPGAPDEGAPGLLSGRTQGRSRGSTQELEGA